MIDVATFHLFGYDKERDLHQAILWYKKAAKLNSPVAHHNLGFLCLQDSDLYEEAIYYFKKATELGYADSAYMLGIVYLQGLGVDKQPDLALMYLEKAYQLGKHYTCRPLGDLYFQGAFNAGQQNHKKALEWYHRGAEHDVLSCIEVLGDCYHFGFGVEINLKLACKYHKEAAEKGSADAAFNLGSMYISGEAGAKSTYEALKWMRLAQKLGQSKADQFVKTLSELVNSNTANAPCAAYGGSVGVSLRSSYSSSVETVEAQQRLQEAQRRKRNAGLYAAAGAMSGDGSYTDYEMGAVINEDGEVSYVDENLGIILGYDGSVSSHDQASGMTYNWSTGETLAYDESFNATLNFSSGNISYHFDGYTIT